MFTKIWYAVIVKIVYDENQKMVRWIKPVSLFVGLLPILTLALASAGLFIPLLILALAGALFGLLLVCVAVCENMPWPSSIPHEGNFCSPRGSRSRGKDHAGSDVARPH